MPPPLRCPSILPPGSLFANQVCRAAQSRSFSTTLPQQRAQKPPPRVTRNRARLYAWLRVQGAIFKDAAKGHTNYLGAYNEAGQLKRVADSDKEKGGKTGKNDGEEQAAGPKTIPAETIRDLRPFPQNPQFVSQPVLGEVMREKIWEAIMREGKSVRQTSAEFGVEMGRVGAVVRLKEIEKEWARIGKPMAKAYASTVLGMLPVTHHPSETGNKSEKDRDDREARPHESINDLPIHAKTGPQIFHPTSESRVFTRKDAAKVFDERLLPADDRVPHPELIWMHKDFKANLSPEEIESRQNEREAEIEKREAWHAERKAKKLGSVKAVAAPRWDFRFTDVNVDDAGKDGRGQKAAGWRYGMPLMDRSRAQVKIPTKVA